ncbi:MAG: hypothetical protein LBE97_02365 [Holosporales bacterium]|nr:hypothetical protein [Holosporales bacterium]
MNIIDISGFVYRAYYAIPHLTYNNVEVGALYGFCSAMKKLIEQFPDSMFIAAMDSSKKTFRNEIYNEYKANRAETPPELLSQIPLIKRACEKFGFYIAEFAGFEADDIIASYVKTLENQNYQINIISSDKDLMQLIHINNVKMYDPIKRIYITEKEVFNKFSVTPDKVLDVLSLTGDSSDNIPGVSGIGPKTAALLINQYGSLDDVIENIDSLPENKKYITLKNEIDKALLSRELAKLREDIPVEFEFSTSKANDINEFFAEFGFKSLIKRQVSVVNSYNIVDTIDNVETEVFIVNFDNTFEILWENASGKNICVIQLLDSIKQYLADETVTKICLDSKNLIKKCLSLAINVTNTIDVSVMSYCASGTKIKHDIKSMQEEYLESIDKSYSENLYNIYKFLLIIVKQDFNYLFFEIENKLTYVLAQMEFYGISIDKNYLAKLSEEFQIKIDEIANEIQKIAGYKFNISSPKQVAFLLFEKLKLPKQNKKESTDQEALSNLGGLADGIADKILAWREFSKLQNTYINPLLALADENNRVHTTYSQTTVNTGRLSSSDPNLQNIPNRSEEGIKIRKSFIAEAEKVIISFDYSQIELRILAHLSQCRKMIDDFQKGEDIHIATAARVFYANQTIEKAQITKDQRRIAKEINFSIIYGISIHQLSKRLALPRKATEKIYTEFMSYYPEIVDYLKSCEIFALNNGYVTTIFERKCFVPLINSFNKNLANFAKRQAINATIQGSNADIIKLAMVRIFDKFQTENEPIKLLLQIHDELVFEVDLDLVERCIKRVSEIMENVTTLQVPLIVDIKINKHL